MSRAKAYALLAGLWLAAIVLVNPAGNFPINDDWAYGKAVQSLLETGAIRLPDFVAAPIVSHVVWGALFCRAAGFSFTVLRFSTLTLAILGTIATYELFLLCAIPNLLSLLTALAVMLNPVFFSQSFTFMTDVPFYTFSVAAMCFYVRALSGRPWSFLPAAVLLTAIAVLCRQLGLFLPLAFAFAYAIKHGVSKKTIAPIVLPAIIAWLTLKGCELALRATTGLPSLYFSKQRQLVDLMMHSRWLLLFFGTSPNPGSVMRKSFTALAYLGLFLLPVALLARPRGKKEKALATIAAVGGVALALLLLRAGRLMPFGCNILENFGIGPQALRDSLLLLPNVPTAPAWLLFLVTAASLGGGLILALLVFREVLELSRSRERRRRRSEAVFALAALSIYFFPIAVVGFFDRYLLVLMPLVVIAAASGLDRTAARRRAALSALALLGLFSVTATHDFLSWNRARWKALDLATRELGVGPEKIDGGMEFNGWRGFVDDFHPAPGKSWWWVQDDEYVVSFRILGGYEAIAEYPYRHWLPPGEGRIYLLRRVPA